MYSHPGSPGLIPDEIYMTRKWCHVGHLATIATELFHLTSSHVQALQHVNARHLNGFFVITRVM